MDARMPPRGPQKPAEARRRNVVVVRLTDGDNARLREIAAVEGTPVAALVGTLIVEALRMRGLEQAPPTWTGVLSECRAVRAGFWREG